eukprot:5687242-Lingulodinium_polyedra.AAC.1
MQCSAMQCVLNPGHPPAQVLCACGRRRGQDRLRGQGAAVAHQELAGAAGGGRAREPHAHDRAHLEFR